MEGRACCGCAGVRGTGEVVVSVDTRVRLSTPFSLYAAGCAVRVLRHGYAAFILFPGQNPDTEVIFIEHHNVKRRKKKERERKNKRKRKH